MSKQDDEIWDGFILRSGRLRACASRELAAATHLIGGFNIGITHDNSVCGTVVWFSGNNRGVKVAGGMELGPQELGTAPRGFWTRLEDELRASMRIDRQKFYSEDGKRFCDYHLQVNDESIACVLVRANLLIGEKVVRRAFTLSLEMTKNVVTDPTDPRQGYMHVKAESR